MRKLIIIALSLAALAAPTAAMAAKPVEVPSAHEDAVHNSNANPNACWGQDRSFYASNQFFGDTMDIKQSFPSDLGGVSEQRAAWVGTYC